jgi:hypothetical protein
MPEPSNRLIPAVILAAQHDRRVTLVWPLCRVADDHTLGLGLEGEPVADEQADRFEQEERVAQVLPGCVVVREQKPWPTLTLAVSLEAIFLSTFVMIGQNRQSAFQQAKADHDFTEQELELKTNTELTRQIHLLTTELHRRLIDEPNTS